PGFRTRTRVRCWGGLVWPASELPCGTAAAHLRPSTFLAGELSAPHRGRAARHGRDRPHPCLRRRCAPRFGSVRGFARYEGMDLPLQRPACARIVGCLKEGVNEELGCERIFDALTTNDYHQRSLTSHR